MGAHCSLELFQLSIPHVWDKLWIYSADRTSVKQLAFFFKLSGSKKMMLPIHAEARQVLVSALWAQSKGIDYTRNLPRVLHRMCLQDPKQAPFLLAPLLNPIPPERIGDVLEDILVDDSSFECFFPEILRRFPETFPQGIITDCILKEKFPDVEKILLGLSAARKKTLRNDMAFFLSLSVVSRRNTILQPWRTFFGMCDKHWIPQMRNPKNIDTLKRQLEGEYIYEEEWQDE